jgi:transcriptional regulator with XRE-family HTH domain
MKNLQLIIGPSIKKIRLESRMTLLELSRRSGVALATLSRIENGKMTGTLESHINIADALGVTLPELYQNLFSPRKAAEFRDRQNKPEIFLHNRKAVCESLVSGAANKKMLPELLRISEGGQTDKKHAKAGIEKFAYLTDGRIEAYIGEERFNLAKGDTLYFAASLPHHFKNTGNGEATIIIVTSQSGKSSK